MRASMASLGALLVVGLGFWQSLAHADIAATQGAWVFGPKAVWTDGTSNPKFHPLSRPLPSARLTDVRVSTNLEEDSGNCKIRPALRYSNDAETWDAAKEIVASYRTTEGTDYGTTYVDITALTTPRAFVQFGVEVANESGAIVNLCNATIRVEPKSQ